MHTLTAGLSPWVKWVEEIEQMQEMEKLLDLSSLDIATLRGLGALAGRVFDSLQAPVLKTVKVKVGFLKKRTVRLKPVQIKVVRQGDSPARFWSTFHVTAVGDDGNLYVGGWFYWQRHFKKEEVAYVNCNSHKGDFAYLAPRVRKMRLWDGSGSTVTQGVTECIELLVSLLAKAYEVAKNNLDSKKARVRDSQYSYLIELAEGKV